ncbi:MAG: DNA repair protein RecO [Bdellovibrionota bacterium]
MNEKQDRFIILKKIKYGESDLIIQALGSDGSRTSFMAKSALKSKKRFGGGILEPLHFVNFTYKENSSSTQLKSLKEASLIDDFKDIRTSYDKLELALFVLNCVSHVSLEGDQHSEFLFNLTGHTLRAVAKTESLDILRLHFCLKFLYQQGVISIEPWMAVFLKNNIMDSALLTEDSKVQDSTRHYLDSIELLVTEYIKTADVGFA